jgi:N-acetylmuramoyl-L-alanine amidase
VSRAGKSTARGVVAALALALAGCHGPPPPKSPSKPAPPASQAGPVDKASGRGDEIIVAGKRFATGTRVVTWLEPGGYDGYGVTSSPRAGLAGPPPRRDLVALQRVVDQFVLHYDGAGLSRTCFNILQERKLSVHFLLDVDGTIYQTLDLRERAAHATIANDRSIGIEIANLGAYPEKGKERQILAEWYRRDAAGRTVMQVPARIKETGIRTPGFVARPVRPDLVRGSLQGKPLVQYDYTPEQYAALAKLTATLTRVFPKMTADYPHGRDGRLIAQALSQGKYAGYRGVLGHFHVQENKVDPGPAFQWRKLFDAVKREKK